MPRLSIFVLHKCACSLQFCSSCSCVAVVSALARALCLTMYTQESMLLVRSHISAEQLHNVYTPASHARVTQASICTYGYSAAQLSSIQYSLQRTLKPKQLSRGIDLLQEDMILGHFSTFTCILRVVSSLQSLSSLAQNDPNLPTWPCLCLQCSKTWLYSYTFFLMFLPQHVWQGQDQLAHVLFLSRVRTTTRFQCASNSH